MSPVYRLPANADSHPADAPRGPVAVPCPPAPVSDCEYDPPATLRPPAPEAAPHSLLPLYDFPPAVVAVVSRLPPAATPPPAPSAAPRVPDVDTLPPRCVS